MKPIQGINIGGFNENLIKDDVGNEVVIDVLLNCLLIPFRQREMNRRFQLKANLG